MSAAQQDHFDAVVVGSGFGGSVSAFRLAEAGLSVCVLERGKPYPPGSFARSPHEMRGNFWDPSEGLHGMFDFWSFKGLDALISSGLGGGSLIYANVMIRKDERWFVRDDGEYWPVTRADLEPHYDRAERMLGATEYPFDREPWRRTAKTRAFEQAAARIGREKDWFLPKLAVTFGDTPGEPIREEHANLHGRTRYSCRLVGECDVGCNYGSKNTLDYNYLSAAQRAGAEIRTRCEVRSFAPRERGGFTIEYVHHDPEREGHKTDTHDPRVVPPRTITADRLVISAGTLGSTYLLLKNHAAFPRLSQALGTHFCGNGDLLTFAWRCSDRSDGHRVPTVVDPTRGPVITSAIRFDDAADGNGAKRRGFYIEDAGFPDFLGWIMQLGDEPAALWAWRKTAKRLLTKWLRRDPETDLSAEIAEMLGDGELAAGMLPLLGMGRDVPDGRMYLQHDKLQVDWSKDGASREYFDEVRARMHDISDALGAEFRDNPIWWLSRVVTVHALGGCPMGRNEQEGVVDSNGQVFGYPGLSVADGSVMPGPVGPNPSLTIAALADRFAEATIEGRHA